LRSSWECSIKITMLRCLSLRSGAFVAMIMQRLFSSPVCICMDPSIHFNSRLCAMCMTSCVSAAGTCSCAICGQLVNNMTTASVPPTPHDHYPSEYLPTPQSLSRFGTQFTPGVGETTVIDEAKESIPFQDLSKLAKRMEWAVVKMTNVLSHLTF
jgi:hypothetical protein